MIRSVPLPPANWDGVIPKHPLFRVPQDKYPADNSIFRAFQERFHLQRACGKGANGQVFLSYDGDRVIKIINFKPDCLGSLKWAQERFKSEAAIIDKVARLQIPHTLPPLRVLSNNRVGAIIFPNGGRDLFSIYLNSIRGPRPEVPFSQIAKDLLETLETLHKNGIIHFDLKPANILQHPKKGFSLIDFGLAEDLSEDNAYRRKTTSWYRAPEAFAQLNSDGFWIFPQDLSSACDIWSLGCILFELIVKEPLIPIWDSDYPAMDHAILQFAIQNRFIENKAKIVRPTNIHSEYLKNFAILDYYRTAIENVLGKEDAKAVICLLERMLQVDPAKRASAKELLKDPIFQDGTKDIIVPAE